MRRRGWGVCVAEVPQVATPQQVLAALLASTPDEPDLALVPHSNAGLYAPAVAVERDVAATVFVDAAIPRPAATMTPPAVLEILETLVDAEGLLPPWTRWWPDDEVAALFPDQATRHRVEAAEPRLPLSYFRAEPPPPHACTGRAGFLGFGDTYASERAAAVDRRWPVRTLPGHHLHMLVDPEAVAAAVAEILGELDRLPRG